MLRLRIEAMKKFKKMPGGVLTGGGDQCRDVRGVGTDRCEGSGTCAELVEGGFFGLPYPPV